MTKTRVREVFLKESEGTFSFLKSKGNYNFDGLSSLRKLLSKERAKLLDTIKYKQPTSIYNLSKILNRPFKAVMDDVKLLERFGFIEFIKETHNGRRRHRPKIVVDEIMVHLKI